jgi:two-component sensor histidine kinase
MVYTAKIKTGVVGVWSMAGSGLTRKIGARRSSKGRLGGLSSAEKRHQSSKKSSERTVAPSPREDQARHERQAPFARPTGATVDRLTRELNHRLRNVFSTVLTIVKHTAARYPQATEYRHALERRLRALSAAAGLLNRCESDSISIEDLIRLELAAFQEGDNVLVSGPDVRIQGVLAQDLAIVLHELTTNAAKYGALSDIRGKLSVTWSLLSDKSSESSLSLEWIEQGGPKTEPPTYFGFGMTVVRESGSILGGTASVEFAPEGLRYRLSIPARRLQLLNDKKI